MWWEVFMRILFFLVAAVLCLMASVAPAQQSHPTTGDAIGHPPPLPGPPPLSQPSSTTQSTPAASTPRATEPAPKGSGSGAERHCCRWSFHTNGQSCALRSGRARDRWIHDLCGNPRSKSKKASALASVSTMAEHKPPRFESILPTKDSGWTKGARPRSKKQSRPSGV